MSGCVPQSPLLSKVGLFVSTWTSLPSAFAVAIPSRPLSSISRNVRVSGPC